MSLPKWAEYHGCHCWDKCPCDTILGKYATALSIAWEALEQGSRYDGTVIHGLNGEALRRISELGNEGDYVKIDNRSVREKSLDNMTLDEQINFWTGQLIISIGRGDFRQTVCGMILAYLSKPNDK